MPRAQLQRSRLNVFADFDADSSQWATASEPLTDGADFPAVAFRHSRNPEPGSPAASQGFILAVIGGRDHLLTIAHFGTATA